MHIIDWAIVGAYTLLTMFVGLRSSTQVTSLKAFALGGCHYGSLALMATLSASYIGGGYTFGLSEKVFSYGLDYVVCLLGFSLQQFLVGFFIAPKMARFKSCLSVGEIMGHVYGYPGRLLTGMASLLVCSGILGAQISAMGYVCQLFLGLSQEFGIGIGCSIVIIYTIMGGMRAVVATDILQFSILIIIIPVIAIIGIYTMGAVEPLTQHAQTSSALPKTMMIGIFLSLLVGEALVPPYVQRLLMTRNVAQTVRGTMMSAAISLPFFLLVGILGMVAWHLNAQLEPTLALPYVINHLMPTGLKGLAVAAIVAVIMSSADSYLNAAAVALVHDIINPSKKIPLKDKQALQYCQYATALIGGIGIIFALSTQSVLDILLYAYIFWAPVILIPFIFTVFEMQVSFKALLSCAFLSLTTIVITQSMFNLPGWDGCVAGTCFSIITMSFCYLWQKNSST